MYPFHLFQKKDLFLIIPTALLGIASILVTCFLGPAVPLVGKLITSVFGLLMLMTPFTPLFALLLKRNEIAPTTIVPNCYVLVNEYSDVTDGEASDWIDQHFNDWELARIEFRISDVKEALKGFTIHLTDESPILLSDGRIVKAYAQDNGVIHIGRGDLNVLPDKEIYSLLKHELNHVIYYRLTGSFD